jgi:hypothetical protein
MYRGDRGAVWFDFDHKSHPNREKKIMRFGLVRLIFKTSSKPNQTNVVRIGSVAAVYTILK